MANHIQQATLVKILPTKIWIESGFLGERVVMMQHEGCDPFEYATFHYDHRYTSNSMTMNAAVAVAKSLGAEDPIEHHHRDLPPIPTADEVRKRIADWQEMLAGMEERGE